MLTIIEYKELDYLPIDSTSDIIAVLTGSANHDR